MRYLLILVFSYLSLFGFDNYLKPYKVSDGIYCFFGFPSLISYKSSSLDTCYIKMDSDSIISTLQYSYTKKNYENILKINHLEERLFLDSQVVSFESNSLLITQWSNGVEKVSRLSFLLESIKENKDNSFKNLQDTIVKEMNSITTLVTQASKAKDSTEVKPKKMKIIHYLSFSMALKKAKKSKKNVLIKIDSTGCKYCAQLDKVMHENYQIGLLIDKYFEVVKLNIDKEKIPLNIEVTTTPTLIFIKPDDKRVLIRLHGMQNRGELLNILNEVVTDGHRDGYLRL